MPTPPRAWTTERLVASPASVADAEALFAEYAGDGEVARYMTWRPHQRVDETVAFLRGCETAWTEGTAFVWVLRVKPSTAAVGVIEARVDPPAVNLGYALARRWWRQGLMSEAVGHVIAWAFEQREIHRVWATCDVENVASARLLERVGMQREGVLRRWIVHPNLGDEPRDCLCYAIVKAGGNQCSSDQGASCDSVLRFSRRS